MSGTSIDTKGDVLLVPTTTIKQLQGEWHHLCHFRFALFQEQACFLWLAGHQWVAMTILYVNEQNVYHPFGCVVVE